MTVNFESCLCKMSEDHKRIYPKKGTGTVPKIKHRNNTSHLNQDDNYQNIASNNLMQYTHVRECDRPKFYSNSELHKKNILKPQYFTMEQLSDEHNTIAKQNGVTFTSNGSISSPSTSASASRRNSLGTICKNDNVTKYPDKKQIEEKLNQIREYLRVTSSLMANMKHTDDQIEQMSFAQSNTDSEIANLMDIIHNLKDSEHKLLATLSALEIYEQGGSQQSHVDSENNEFSENGLENYSDAGTCEQSRNDLQKQVVYANREIEKLQQDNLLLNLQIKAENQLKDAIQVQQRLLQNSKETNHQKQSKSEDEGLDVQINSTLLDILGNATAGKSLNDIQYDPIRDIEERLKHLNDSQTSSSRPSSSNLQEHLISQMDALQQKIGIFQETNDQGVHLMQLLDNRDSQLQNEHMELQAKLKDLQERKMQVDNLVSQLETMNEESEEDDVGDQVRKMVTMKKHLEKLKGMLEVVKDTETLLEAQNVSESDNEAQDTTRTICAKTDNLRCSKNRTQSESNASGRLDGSMPLKDRKINEKQVNKSIINANERERMKLQSELQAKKRELEELMCKHKAVTSNLNQDFHNDNKIDHAGLLESASNTWYPAPNVYNLPPSDRYSSDECPDEDVSQVNSTGDTNNINTVQPMPSFNYPTSNYVKRRDLDPRLDLSTEFHQHSPSKTPERSTKSGSITTPTFQREMSASNASNDLANKTQIQKQLELIRSVCDSILDHQSGSTQQVRNNLTPSPIYSEPRQYTSPSAHTMNALNVINHGGETASVPPAAQSISPNDVNYQNWLTTNNLQTQAFMLNTLNQCCQMLWLQQRELASLKSSVSLMQERFPNVQCDPSVNALPPFMPAASPLIFPLNPPTPFRSINNPKTNQVSSATSMPNLNHMQVSQTNMDSAYANNLQSARLLDSGLNNTVGEHPVNNTVLHSVNQPLPSQIWNGQALNNQVAPGNRANNYWDNFRSYSRQNLLSTSTKSNEGFQNLTSIPDRSPNSAERSPNSSYTLPSVSVPKLNTNHYESTNASVENTPRRRTVFKSPRDTTINSISHTAVPPDVLNINQIQSSPIKSNGHHQEIVEMQIPLLNDEDFHGNNVIQPFLNVYDNNEAELLSNVPDDQYKNWSANNHRNRNEWHEEPQDNLSSKSKLFDALRENVYREVASLISANQGRPHFLIQLFRDLQLISSDPLRRQTLQSIQALITQSVCVERGIQDCGRQPPADQNAESFEVMGPIGSNIPDYLSEVLIFLNAHSEDKLQPFLLESFKKILIDSTFSTIFANIKDDVIQKHFSNLIAESLEQYRNKMIKDVRLTLLQTIEELYRGEISFLRFMRENLTDEGHEVSDPQQINVSFELSVPNVIEIAPQMQNEDLAEADQSRISVDDDEEGAVGGILIDRNCHSIQMTSEETDMPKIEYPIDVETSAEIVEQGLDQVPTRLLQSSKTRSVTPNRDRSNSSKSDVPEQF